MKCVILCGGLGTRMREETEFRPKPMVPIGERPILWHIMKGYAAYGFSEFVLVLGYRSEMIKDYFMRYDLYGGDIAVDLGKPGDVKFLDSHSENNWKITLADTGVKTLKGGRLKRIEKYIGDDDIFLMTYGDGVSDVNISKLIEFHKSHGKIATVTGVSPAARFGELKTDGNRVISFHEKPENSHEYVNGGFFVFNRKIFDYLTPDENCDLEYGALEELSVNGELIIFRHDGFWSCMDNLRDVEHLNSLWDEGSAPWKVW